MCVEQSLPATADLIIIENMASVSPEIHEQIAWRLLQHYSSPTDGHPGSSLPLPAYSVASSSSPSEAAAGGAAEAAGMASGGLVETAVSAAATSATAATAAARRRLPGRLAGHSAAGSHHHRPALILFNTAYVATPPWDCYYSYVPNCCANLTVHVGPDMRSGESDAPHNLLADYYGFASISHR